MAPGSDCPCLLPRVLGTSGILVSGMSLGSWRTYERMPRADGVSVLRAAREQGITFFDDARYNDETGAAPIPTGYSEVVFGELFRGAGLRRDDVVVANKLWWEFWPEQDAAEELDGSLRRMGFDYIDLIYASAPPDGMSVADLVSAVAGLVTSGRTRTWGVLNWPVDVIAAAVEAAAATSAPLPCAAQLPYSLVQRSPVEDGAMRQVLASSGIGVVASFSLAGGVLSGKYRSAGATGRAAGQLDEPRYAAGAAAAERLADLADDLGTSAAALALAFPLTNPAVTSVLFGATSAQQVRGNCDAAEVVGRLGEADLARLRSVGEPAA
jgi:aryl-alcohol dehydrogenase-like predicted oxidoreductase